MVIPHKSMCFIWRFRFATIVLDMLELCSLCKKKKLFSKATTNFSTWIQYSKYISKPHYNGFNRLKFCSRDYTSRFHLYQLLVWFALLETSEHWILPVYLIYTIYLCNSPFFKLSGRFIIPVVFIYTSCLFDSPLLSLGGS